MCHHATTKLFTASEGKRAASSFSLLISASFQELMRWGIITIDRYCLRFIVFTMVIQYCTFVAITRSITFVCFLHVDVTIYFYHTSSSEKAMKRATTISRSVEVGLRFTGMWPDSAYPNLYCSMYMTVIVVLLYYQYLYIVVHFNLSNLSSLSDCLVIALANTLALFKLFSLWWNRR